MVKIKRFLAILFVIIVLTITLTSCVSWKALAISDKTKVRWYSTNSRIEFFALDFATSNGFGYLIDNEGEEIEILFQWFPATWSFWINPIESGKASEGEILLSGEFEEHPSGAKLIIEHDEVFGNAYSEIILSFENIDTDAIDSSRFTQADWKSATPQLEFTILSNQWKGGFGFAMVGNIKHDIFFRWEPDSKFSIFLVIDNVADEVAVISGSYFGLGKAATLTIEVDLLFGGQYASIELCASKSTRIN